MDQIVQSEKAGGKPALSKPSLTVVVPFYKNPQLVQPLFRSIRDCEAELKELNAQVVFYNDSPDDDGLRAELWKVMVEQKGLALSICENQANLGFVGTVNAAFDKVIAEGGDVILLNSDTVVFPGVFREMTEVAYSDPMIGFVCPRSNNATLATFPHGADKLDLTPEEHYARFEALAPLLPRVSYVPVAVGFCLYIKGHILRDFGGFDAVYGKGYNEENDLICRANQYGYRAALANHAFTWHQGEQSFALDGGKALRDAENARLLNSRYPDYLPRVWAYFDSPEYMAERVLTGLKPAAYRQSLGFDFSHFGPYHNGTFEAGKRLLEAAAETWPDDVEIVVLCRRDVFEFHSMGEGGRVRWCDTHDPDLRLTAIVRLGQVFDKDSLSRLLVRAPVVSIFMLDTISIDCGYLSVEFDPSLWSFIMKWSDVVFGISRFTVDQLRRRYLIGDQTQLVPVLLSMAPDEYVSSTPVQFEAASAPPAKPSQLLVIGNKFKHKGMELAVKALAEGLPEARIVALGLKESEYANVEPVASGHLSDEEVHELYRQADAVVFPTHYEGFGFPVMHALARLRPIYVRRLPVFEEIARSFTSGQENIRWFDDDRDLVRLLQDSFEPWRGGAPAGETQGWRRGANEVYATLQKSIETASFTSIADRFRWFFASFCRPVPEASAPESRPLAEPPSDAAPLDGPERVAEFIGHHTRRVFLGLFRQRGAYRGARIVWRLMRYGRLRQT